MRWQVTERRLRRTSVFLVLLCLAMLVTGLTVLEPHLDGYVFLAWWFLCFVLTLAAALAALVDILVLRNIGRALDGEFRSGVHSKKRRTDGRDDKTPPDSRAGQGGSTPRPRDQAR